MQTCQTNRKPITIIKYGPPASGKSSNGVKMKIKEILRTTQNIPTQTNFTTFLKKYKTENSMRNLLNINMNKPIESYQKYIQSSQQLKAKYKKSNGTHYINRLTPEDTSKMLKLYLKYAQEFYKISNEELTKANTNCSDVIVETSGQNGGIPKWLKFRGDRIYHLIFPIIEFETLWERYKHRANKGVFRVLSTKNELRNVYINSYNFFLNTYKKHKLEIHILFNQSDGKETFLTLKNGIKQIRTFLREAKKENN